MSEIDLRDIDVREVPWRLRAEAWQNEELKISFDQFSDEDFSEEDHFSDHFSEVEQENVEVEMVWNDEAEAALNDVDD